MVRGATMGTDRSPVATGPQNNQPATGTEHPAPLARVFHWEPLPAGRFWLKRMDRRTLAVHTVGRYTQESDAEKDRAWFNEHEPEGVYVVSR